MQAVTRSTTDITPIAIIKAPSVFSKYNMLIAPNRISKPLMMIHTPAASESEQLPRFEFTNISFEKKIFGPMDEFFSAIGKNFAGYEKLLQYKAPKLEIVYKLVSGGEETLVTENIPELESLVTAIGVLLKNYSDHVFTPAQIQRCNHIFRLIMIHCSYVEYDTPTQTAFGFEEAGLYPPGHFPKKREDLLADLKSTPEILVICYEVEQSGREFTLLELLTDDKAYEIFSHVWENRPKYNFCWRGDE